MKAVRLIITGRVQGVGYRDWAITTARNLGLRGWVRNRTDDSVEALIAGEDAAVAAMIEGRRMPGSAKSMSLQPMLRTRQKALRSFRRPDVFAEHLVESFRQRDIEIGQGDQQSEVDQRGHAMVGDAAGHDSRVVRQVGLDVDRNAVERHPVADAHADGGDLVLARMAVG